MKFLNGHEILALKGRAIVKLYDNNMASIYQDGLSQVYGAIELDDGSFVGVAHVVAGNTDDLHIRMDSLLSNDRVQVKDLIGRVIQNIVVWENTKHKGNVIKSESYIEIELDKHRRIFVSAYLSQDSDTCEFGDFCVETLPVWLTRAEMDCGTFTEYEQR